MRKFILITAMVLASASARAGTCDGAVMASNDAPAPAVEAAKPAEVPKAEAPKYVERPAVDTTAEAPKADQLKPAPEKSSQILKADKPKHRHESTEARVIYELHRHGFYW
jgi:hypothetical protein